MARGGPSLAALLGLVALAGYQNRDKISDMLGRAQRAAGDRATVPDRDAAAGGFDFAGLFGAAGGGTLAGGLKDLIDGFTGSSARQKAESWVRPGANDPVGPDDLAAALGDDTIDEVAAKTGLTRAEVLARLQRDLPQAVDGFTPKGRLPEADEAAGYY